MADVFIAAGYGGNVLFLLRGLREKGSCYFLHLSLPWLYAFVFLTYILEVLIFLFFLRDTAGQERYRTIIKDYYRDAQVSVYIKGRQRSKNKQTVALRLWSISLQLVRVRPC